MRILLVYHSERQIYWCDSHTERIEAANLDGSGRRTIYIGKETEDPFGIAVQGSFIYWTDWNLKGISRLNKNGSQYERKYQNFFRGLNDVKFFNRTASNGLSTALIYILSNVLTIKLRQLRDVS